MRNALAIFAGLLAIYSTIPYIKDIIKGKTKPNIVTWFTWASINIILFFASLAGHAYQTALFSAATAFCTSMVVILGLKHGTRKFTLFDIICQILAVLAIVLWRMSGNPNMAIVISIIADLIAVMPTYRHAWLAPAEETWQSYLLGAASAAIVLLSVTQVNFTSVAFPLYLVFSDGTLVGVILFRHSVHMRKA